MKQEIDEKLLSVGEYYHGLRMLLRLIAALLSVILISMFGCALILGILINQL